MGIHYMHFSEFQRSQTSNDLCKMLRFRFTSIIIIIVFSFSFWSSKGSDFVRASSYYNCLTPNGVSGQCRNLRECEPLYQLLVKSKSRPPPSVIDFLRRSHCGFEKNDPVVCCPKPEEESQGRAKPTPWARAPLHEDKKCRHFGTIREFSLTFSKRFALFWKLKASSVVHWLVSTKGRGCLHLPKKAKRLLKDKHEPVSSEHVNKSCGSINTLDKIIGGSLTTLYEFPWMALIGYNTRNGLQYRCGGTLISSRYVLTAAHCITTTNLSPALVRLGEHNLGSQEDCEDGTGCAPPVMDVTIEELIPHPNYSKPQLLNDIALIKLSQPVNTSESIRPICLPLEEEIRERILEENTAVVTGWGTTKTGIRSQILLKATVPIVPRTECSKIYRKEVSITESQICAGGEANRDSCSGDSGGPLQVIGLNPLGEPAYIQHGIVSFGPRHCGTKGIPGVYTKVSHYVDWILTNMKEN